MINVITRLNYPKASRNYAQLWTLAHTQSVICMVDWRWGSGETCRDVAQTIAVVDDCGFAPTEIQVNARGICYIKASEREAFLEACQKLKLEWIEP